MEKCQAWLNERRAAPNPGLERWKRCLVSQRYDLQGNSSQNSPPNVRGSSEALDRYLSLQPDGQLAPACRRALRWCKQHGEKPSLLQNFSSLDDPLPFIDTFLLPLSSHLLLRTPPISWLFHKGRGRSQSRSFPLWMQTSRCGSRK